MRRTITILALGGAALLVFALYSQSYQHTYSYRYRLNIAVDINNKVYSGSSVVEVRWVPSSRIDVTGPFLPHIKGQAIVINVPPQGVIVAMLGHPWRNHGKGAALWIAARAFGNQSTTSELPKLSSLTGRRKILPDDIPELLWLPNARDLSTAKRITVGDFPDAFGPNAHLADASVEITRDPVVVDIDRSLPWYEDLAARQRGHPIISRPGQDILTYYQFVGDD